MAQRSSTAWVKAEPNASTNTIASLRTEIAEKDRKISLLENELEKANKHKMQTTTLMNSLQRENSAKDTLVHQAKNEVNKLKKELREKDASISSLSAKVGCVLLQESLGDSPSLIWQVNGWTGKDCEQADSEAPEFNCLELVEKRLNVNQY